jgi:hypothetical protein
VRGKKRPKGALLGMSAEISQISIVPWPDGIASPGSLYWWNGENWMFILPYTRYKRLLVIRTCPR